MNESAPVTAEDTMKPQFLRGSEQYEAFRKILGQEFRKHGIEIINDTHRTEKIAELKHEDGRFLTLTTDKNDTLSGSRMVLTTSKNGVVSSTNLGEIHADHFRAEITAYKNAPHSDIITYAVQEAKRAVPLPSRHDPVHARYFFTNARQTSALIEKLSGYFESQNIPRLTSAIEQQQPSRDFFTLKRPAGSDPDEKKWEIDLVTLKQGQREREVPIADIALHGGHSQITLNREYKDFLILAKLADEAKKAHSIPRRKASYLQALSETAQHISATAPASSAHTSGNATPQYGHMTPAMRNWEDENNPAIQSDEEITKRLKQLRAEIAPQSDPEKRIEMQGTALGLENYMRERAAKKAASAAEDAAFLKSLKDYGEPSFDDIFALLSARNTGKAG